MTTQTAQLLAALARIEANLDRALKAAREAETTTTPKATR